MKENLDVSDEGESIRVKGCSGGSDTGSLQCSCSASVRCNRRRNEVALKRCYGVGARSKRSDNGASRFGSMWRAHRSLINSN